MNNINVDQLYRKFEKVVTTTLILSMMLAVLYAAVVFVTLVLATIIELEPLGVMLNLLDESQSIQAPMMKIQNALFQVFGGFLLILMGFELINSIKNAASEYSVKVDSIICIALIASARHLIILDYHHADPVTIFGAGFVVLCLIVGYVILRFKIPYREKENKEAQTTIEEPEK